ncbi:hypothetical protein DWQ65_06930 [Treponema phagedenis]|uniref:Uncharacterized protein n=1 Tax=Treponema phagedenis TaxID=162 RepID=A0A0B7GVD1_TREPH|nr:hypothetical protein [Treponema phagedenis]EFW39468.1 hypothetical protein HMPREF9554_00025 [Treponema phagedenis F0421]NVP25362.1 hypothetical protein [Treponema phagedenis]QEJ94855.1 hypothetical protein FUT79_06290 [Treponema phagedenis]QEJ97839.1 hypothetical protein FUT82_07425 [Treponema phagedenis]QEK00755.1 hypothetical protein FUT84_05950 [Treponema phagedenis]
MIAGERKQMLELPLKLILTDEGTTFFIKRNKKLLRFKLAGNVEEYGISLEKFMPETIQRLLLADYISKIEISKSEFVSSRQEIMDLSKLIVFSVLYRQYDDFIFKQILNSPVIKRWNRVNPASIIDEKTHINERFLANILKKNEQLIYDSKQEILTPMYSFINKNDQLRPEEKNIQFFLGEKFLNNLRPFTWFIITKFKSSADFETLLKTIRSSLAEYMDKTRIAEYISLMLMELILSAENMNLRKEAKKLYPDLTDGQEALFDPNIRRRLVAELERNQELVFVSWKLGGGSTTSIGTQGKLQVTLYSKNEQSEAVKNNLNDIKNTDVNKNSLIDFYRDLPEGQQDSNLGMYYISYLSEACEKVNVRFESSANRFENSDLTVINLSFMF